MDEQATEYDAIVIGTGFGGSVTAARLVQAGQRILVLERGMRYSGEAFPALPSDEQILPDGSRYVWSSAEGRLGIWDVRDLGAMHAVSAAGYGGGSLLYASVQLRAPDDAFDGWPSAPGHEYRREALDPYYDLAAYMLDVRTLDQARPKLHPLRKNNALRAAARHIGREAFYTPLAVALTDGTNKFGREQKACVACGECNSGCRHQAKNSLDLNYLAIVEDARDEQGVPLATIRTLAEVYAIEPFEAKGDPKAPRYRVRFYDHCSLDQTLRPAGRKHESPDEAAGPGKAKALARSVFVCAGALGSTELLFRSQKALKIAALPIGKGFFGNSDALGVVFNTKHPQDPDVGPVITTALVHRGEGPKAPWLMIQDGGYGKGVHALVQAVLGSPAWGGRNRFYELDPSGPAAAKLDDDSDPIEAPPFARSLQRRRNASLLEGFSRVELAHELVDIIPAQLASAAGVARKRTEAWAANDIDETIRAMQTRIVTRVAQHWASVCKDTLAYPYVEAAFKAFFGGVAKLLIRIASSGAKTSEGESTAPLAVAALRTLIDRHELGDQRTVMLKAIGALTQHMPSDARDTSRKHTAVLLAMGRDQQPYDLQLLLDKAAGESDQEARLVAEMRLQSRAKEERTHRLYSDQERLMREVASALGGELRLNPAWSQARTPITVHGQGGCAMSVSPRDGVTDVFGQVHGMKGLYVMDAAIFPSPVGVNPSATILAIAERNIEHYIREHVEHKAPPAYQQQRAAAETYMQAHAEKLKPKAIESQAKTPKLRVEPIGIAFTERMFGFASASQNDKLDGSPRTEGRYSAFETCYFEGRKSGETVDVTLDVTVPNLGEFLEDQEFNAEVAGTLVVRGGRPLRGTGTVQILPQGPSSSQRLFRYALSFEREAGLPPLTLTGHKRVRDEPGQDEWKDTTSLFFWLRDQDPKSAQPLLHGVMRVSLDEFLFEQLPSMEVTGLRHAPDADGNNSGAEDPASVVWPLVSFGSFFFGNLASVYLREVGFFRRLTQRAHSLDHELQTKTVRQAQQRKGAVKDVQP